jgi:hypothetical protein
MSRELAEAAAWIAEAIGYPIETRMPDHPMPAALWDALVDHIHADEAGKWHGNELDRDETESWLACEAGLTTNHAARGDVAGTETEEAV